MPPGPAGGDDNDGQGPTPAVVKTMPFRHALFVRGGASPPPPAAASPSRTQQASPAPPFIQPTKGIKTSARGSGLTEKTISSKRSLPSQPTTTPAAAAAAAAAADTPLTIALPGGAQGFRAALLARNWVVKSSGKARTEEGLFIALLLDHKRIPYTIVQSMRKSSGFDPILHDSVLFFHRRGKKLAGSFGAVMKGSWSVWNREAYDCYAEKDRGAAEAFQHFLEDEVFEWLECENCKKWRMYPVDDVVLPKEQPSFFVCALAGNWNPAIEGCLHEQEFSTDSVTSTSRHGSPLATVAAAAAAAAAAKRVAAPAANGGAGEGREGGDDAAAVVAAVTRALKFSRREEGEEGGREEEVEEEGGGEEGVSNMEVDEQVEEEKEEQEKEKEKEEGREEGSSMKEGQSGGEVSS